MSVTITDVDELQAMGDDLTEDYILGNNIDASATETWNANAGLIPIGFYGTPFTGTFDGAGYTISDLWIRRNTVDKVGLFGETDGATIEDVTLSDITIWGDDQVGTLVGWAENTTITDCHASGTVYAGFSYNNYIGGLIGFGYNNTLTRCSSSCAVTGYDYVGGLIGWGYQDTISQCYATGNVTGNDNYVGGLMGVSQQNDIDDCYARGAVDGDRYVGGLIGYGYDATETIDNCYSAGAVTGNTDVGGMMGFASSTVSDCFWDTTTSGQAASAAGTGKTTAQMIALATFYSLWDIDQTATDRNDGYPFLSWEISESDTIWKIYGEGTYSITSSTNFPDLMDDKGRRIKNARIEAYRTDTHSLVDTQITDANGTATFAALPAGKDVIFVATWGGIAQPKNQRWFFFPFYDVDEGGTGGGTAARALSSLGLGTEDSPQFTAIDLGHASDTTLTRAGAGRIAILDSFGRGKRIVRSAGVVSDNEVVRFSGTIGDLVK